MLRVFLSYKKDIDSKRAAVVRTKLESYGVDVFQDVDMSAGLDFHGILHEQISASVAVLVLWTTSSIKSRWVSAEAQHGLDSEKLVAVTFDRISPKDMRMPFNGVQTPDLSDWIETGAEASHPGWRSVLKALGALFDRPILEIADIIEGGSSSLKANYVQKYPNDPFSVGLVRELRAAKLHEFEQQSNRAKYVGEKRLADEVRRLDQLSSEFVKLVDVALTNGKIDSLDAKQIIQRTLEGSHDINDARPGKRGRKEVSEQIARMRAEINALRDSKNAVENAKAEIANDAVQLNSQLEYTKGKLLDSQNLCEQARAQIASQSNKIEDLEERGNPTRRASGWLIAIFVAVLSAIVTWSALNIFGQGSESISVSVAADRQKLQEKLDATVKQLDVASVDRDSLSKDSKRLSDRLGEASTRLDAANSAVNSLTKKLDTANTAVESLNKDKKQLSDQLSVLSMKLDTASGVVASAAKDKQKLIEQANEANLKLDAATAKMTSLSQQLTVSNANLASVTKNNDDLAKKLSDRPNENPTRAASEARCDELAAYDTDSDLPASAKRPSDPNKIPLGTAQEAIDNCLTALSSLPQQTSRRILLQLARGYILQGHPSRLTDQASATSSYSIAVSLAELASRLGSAQAETILGYIFGGGVNGSRSNYVLPNTPDYTRAWKHFEASAAAKNPFGLLYAGSYLMWPGCSQNQVPSNPGQGLQYIRLAQDKKIAAAYYAEGYYWYFGAPGVKIDPGRGLDLFDKAKKLNFAQADAFFGKSPPKPDTCPKAIF